MFVLKGQRVGIKAPDATGERGFSVDGDNVCKANTYRPRWLRVILLLLRLNISVGVVR